MISNEMPEKIKNRLYPVVLQLFSQNDFHKVNMRDISGVSGVSTSTLYKYHASKEDILFAVLDAHITAIGTRVQQELVEINSTREIFRRLFLVTMDYYDRNPGVAITSFITVPMRTWMKEESYKRESEHRIMKEVLAKARLRNDFDTTVPDRLIADFYYMFCYRHIHSWYYHGMKWKLADTISDFFEYFWRMVKPENRAG